MGQERTDYYVYVGFRPWDGSPCYVGKGRGKRWRQHEQNKNHYNKNLARIIAKAGGTIPWIKVREGLTNKQACEIEISLIAAIGRKASGGPLVNLTDGGDGKVGYVTPPATREKIARSNTGKTASKETRAKMSAAGKNKPKSPAHNAAVSAALKNKPKSPEARANMRAASAIRWSKKTEREKLRSYHASMTAEEKAHRSLTIKQATIAAMADPAIRAKISESRQAR